MVILGHARAWHVHAVGALHVTALIVSFCRTEVNGTSTRPRTFSPGNWFRPAEITLSQPRARLPRRPVSPTPVPLLLYDRSEGKGIYIGTLNQSSHSALRSQGICGVSRHCSCKLNS